MTRSLAALAALAAVLPWAAPAAAEVQFDQRAELQYQSWTWAGPSSNASLSFASPMTVYTVMDYTGVIFGAVSTVAANETRRMAAEREAIRKGEYRYSYEVEEGHPREGTHFGFQVGQGGVLGPAITGGATNIAATANTTRMAKILLEGDVAEFFDGVLVFETATAYWSAIAMQPNGTKALDIEAWNWPLGLRFRYAPRFLPGLVIEPGANFDWLYTLAGGVNGNWRWDARNVGLEVSYHVLPQLKLRGGVAVNSLAHNAVPWMKTEEMVKMNSLNLGATLFF